jgi:hypothetical protein
METIFTFFESLFKNFTWSRFTFLVFALASTGAGLYFYESYTSHFKLTRIQEEIKVVNQIADLEKRFETQKNSATLKNYISKLQTTFEEPTAAISFYPSLSKDKMERLTYQSLPWVILLVIGAIATKDEKLSFVGGCIVIASPLIVLGYNLPMPDSKWLVNYLYPWGSFSAVLALILFLQRKPGR